MLHVPSPIVVNAIMVYFYDASSELVNVGEETFVRASAHIGVADVEIDAPTFDAVTDVLEILQAPRLKADWHPCLTGSWHQVPGIMHIVIPDTFPTADVSPGLMSTMVSHGHSPQFYS